MTVKSFISESIEPARIRKVDGGVEILVSGKPRNLGVGFVESFPVSSDIRIMLAHLSGQPECEAVVDGYKGLILELRLAGRSESTEIDGYGRVGVLDTGDMEIVGNPEQARWNVKAPSQSSFRTVAVGFSEEWLLVNRDVDPHLFDYAHRIFSKRQIICQKGNTRCIAIAEMLLSIDWQLPGAKVDVLGLAMRFFSACLSDVAGSETKPDPSSSASIPDFAARMINDNPATSMTLKTVAEACGTSEATLQRMFKKRFGVSLGAYAKQSRMRLAREMLQDEVPIASVATILGYSTPEAFGRVVKQVYGVTPGKLATKRA